MSRLEPKGIFLGLVLLALAIASSVLIFTLRNSAEQTPPAETEESP